VQTEKQVSGAGHVGAVGVELDVPLLDLEKPAVIADFLEEFLLKNHPDP